MRRDHGCVPHARIDASVNVNPLGPPGSLDAVFDRSRELASRYPEIDARSAREAWANRLGAPVARVLIGNGASELISLVVRAIAPKRVVIFDPCYSEYASAARSAGAALVHVPLVLEGDAWRTSFEGLALGEGDLIVLGQPNNPTGHLIAVEEIVALSDRGPRVLVDESFLALSGPPDDAATVHSLAPHVGPHVSVVASLTKTYCVPGLRLGYLIADEPLVERISELRDPWSVNGIAAESAVVLAADAEYVHRARALLTSERPRLAAALRGLGMHVTNGVAPWVLAELPAPASAAAVRSDLLARGIAIRDASSFRGLSDRWIRIGVRTAKENDAVVAALQDASEHF
jgi:threonine-phosphate decarboxylase